MKIRLKHSIAGLNYSYGKGTHDVPDHIAKNLISSGNAIAINDDLPKGLNDPIFIKEPVIKTTVIKKPVTKKRTYKKRK